MLAIRCTHDTRPESGPSLALTLLLAAGAGLSVASLYYSQPMLPTVARSLHASDAAAGAIPMLTQLGYALGILLLAPLGDRYDRRVIMLIKSVLLAGSLLLSALAPDMPWMMAASLAVGLTATLAQDFIPAAATLAPAHRRGRVVGTVMTGLLLGILLSRLVSGYVAQAASWQVMFEMAAGGALLIAVGVWMGVPAFEPTTRLGYRALLASMAQLWRRHSALRRAAFAQGLLSLAFSAFWSTLAIVFGARYGLGSGAAGAFGLAGAAGALAAPLAGRIADRHGPRTVALAGAGLAAVSFALMAGMPLLSDPGQIVLIAASAIGFDFAVQAALVAHQSIVYGIEPAARSRLNALLYTGIFIGMAAGAFLGSVALAHFGWTGVVVLATASSLAALAVRALTPSQL
jgi:predicted MFS family arabinose efflux permease